MTKKELSNLLDEASNQVFENYQKSERLKSALENAAVNGKIDNAHLAGVILEESAFIATSILNRTLQAVLKLPD